MIKTISEQLQFSMVSRWAEQSFKKRYLKPKKDRYMYFPDPSYLVGATNTFKDAEKILGEKK